MAPTTIIIVLDLEVSSGTNEDDELRLEIMSQITYSPLSLRNGGATMKSLPTPLS